MGSVMVLVDCNSFFCSCERLFAPKLKNKPIVVLSNNDGCVISRTQEAKDLGIPMGVPYFQVKGECKKKGIHVFSANFPLYTSLSARVMNVLREFCLQIEVYSVDEAWLTVPMQNEQELEKLGRTIKERVERLVGIPVSVGIATTKVLSKAASDLAKNHPQYQGVMVLTEKCKQDEWLAKLPVGHVWGVGRKSALKLKVLNIRTAKELRDYKNPLIIQKTLTIIGTKTQLELQGISCFELSGEEDKKSIMYSRSFGMPVTRLKDLSEVVASFTTFACEKLRGQRSLCQSIGLFFRTSYYGSEDHHYGTDWAKLESPSDDTRVFINLALKLLKENYKSGHEYKKAGVYLGGICQDGEWQPSLFQAPQEQSEHSQKLMNCMDHINQVYGPGTIKSAACGVDNQHWHALAQFRTKRFTTSFHDLMWVG